MEKETFDKLAAIDAEIKFKKELIEKTERIFKNYSGSLSICLLGEDYSGNVKSVDITDKKIILDMFNNHIIVMKSEIEELEKQFNEL